MADVTDGTMMLLAVPSLEQGGLEGERSGHFGQCDSFTLVEIREGAVGSVRVLENPPHEHGGCLRPVEILSANGVTALVVAGIGGRPLAGFAQAGIDVYFDDVRPGIGEVVEAVAAGTVPLIDPGTAADAATSAPKSFDGSRRPPDEAACVFSQLTHHTFTTRSHFRAILGIDRSPRSSAHGPGCSRRARFAQARALLLAPDTG